MTNKFIYLKLGGESEEMIGQAESTSEFLTGMGKLDVEAYQIDLTDEEGRKALMDLLAARGSTLTEDFVLKNQYILGNKFDDLWF